MKNSVFFVFLLFLTLFSSCSKDQDDVYDPKVVQNDTRIYQRSTFVNTSVPKFMIDKIVAYDAIASSFEVTQVSTKENISSSKDRIGKTDFYDIRSTLDIDIDEITQLNDILHENVNLSLKPFRDRWGEIILTKDFNYITAANDTVKFYPIVKNNTVTHFILAGHNGNKKGVFIIAHDSDLTHADLSETFLVPELEKMFGTLYLETEGRVQASILSELPDGCFHIKRDGCCIRVRRFDWDTGGGSDDGGDNDESDGPSSGGGTSSGDTDSDDVYTGGGDGFGGSDDGNSDRWTNKIRDLLIRNAATEFLINNNIDVSYADKIKDCISIVEREGQLDEAVVDESCALSRIKEIKCNQSIDDFQTKYGLSVPSSVVEAIK